MPSIFSTLKAHKRKAQDTETLKRIPPTPTPLPSYNSSKTGSDSRSRHSRASEGQTGKDTRMLVLPSPPPIIDSSETRSRNSGNNVLSILPPTPKTLSQPELSHVVSQNPTTSLARKCSKVSFSDMKFLGTSALSGHGRKSQHQGVEDKEPLSDMKTQVSMVDDKEVGNGAVPHPIHGIMKTATNVSTGAGMHSVRFTLDLPPKLDLDLSLSVEKVEGGSSDRKDGTGLTRKPSRWGVKTTEAVLDRSKVVSTEFSPHEGDEEQKGGESDESLKERHDADEVSLNDPADKAISLQEQQSIQRNYSHTSSISTLECEPSFTIYRLEGLAIGLEPIRNGRRALPVAPIPGHVSTGQERVFSRNGMLGLASGIKAAVRDPTSSVNSSRMALIRKESNKGYESNGCVST